MRWISLIFAFSSLTSVAQVVQNFSLTNVTNGQYVALTDFSSQTGVVIIFTSTDCPYDTYYLSRIQELSDAYQSRITILLINPNPGESMDRMKKYVDQNKLTVPYLWDLEQKAMAALAARKSPECFLLQNTGGKFTVVYKGAIDDNAQTASEVNHFYLKEAIDRLLAKQKIETPEVRPVGCSIRKN
jgi:peroxiredoxin